MTECEWKWYFVFSRPAKEFVKNLCRLEGKLLETGYCSYLSVLLAFRKLIIEKHKKKKLFLVAETGLDLINVAASF